MMATLRHGQYNKLIEDLHAKKETRTVLEVTASVYVLSKNREKRKTEEEIEKFNSALRAVQQNAE